MQVHEVELKYDGDETELAKDMSLAQITTVLCSDEENKRDRRREQEREAKKMREDQRQAGTRIDSFKMFCNRVQYRDKQLARNWIRRDLCMKTFIC